MKKYKGAKTGGYEVTTKCDATARQFSPFNMYLKERGMTVEQYYQLVVKGYQDEIRLADFMDAKGLPPKYPIGRDVQYQEVKDAYLEWARSHPNEMKVLVRNVSLSNFTVCDRFCSCLVNTDPYDLSQAHIWADILNSGEFGDYLADKGNEAVSVALGLLGVLICGDDYPEKADNNFTNLEDSSRNTLLSIAEKLHELGKLGEVLTAYLDSPKSKDKLKP